MILIKEKSFYRNVGPRCKATQACPKNIKNHHQPFIMFKSRFFQARSKTDPDLVPQIKRVEGMRILKEIRLKRKPFVRLKIAPP